MEARSTWNQELFDSILKQYLSVSSRDVVTAINTKGFYIARAATRMTMKAGKGKIEAGLGKIVSVKRTAKDGKVSYQEAPLAAVIINRRLGRAGEGGLYGRAMKKAIRDLIAARKRSNAFLASGWIDAIKTLEPLADRGKRPPMAPAGEMKRYGTAKGDAIPAVLGPDIVVTIHNKAVAKRDKKDALGKYGTDGLVQAFESEANSMLQYIDRKLQQATATANSRL